MEFLLTNEGTKLLSKVLGGAKLIFTKAVSGDDFSSNSTALVSISNKKQDLIINNLIERDGIKGLSITLTNLELKESYRLRQMGVFAKVEGTEDVLFLVGQDEIGERIPAISTGEVEINYEVFIKNSSSYQMSININSNDFIKKSMIVDNLGTDNSSLALSARQGKILGDSISEFKREIILRVPGSAWNSINEFFVAEISASEIKAGYNPVMFATLDNIVTAREVKEYTKNYAFIHRGETLDGLVRLYAYKKPKVDLSIGLRGR